MYLLPDEEVKHLMTPKEALAARLKTIREETHMYKIYEVEGGYEVFWCPFAPIHFNERTPYDGKVYSKRQAAYRKCKQLNERLALLKSAQNEVPVN